MISFNNNFCECDTDKVTEKIERICCSLATVTYKCPRCGKRIKNIEYTLEEDK